MFSKSHQQEIAAKLASGISITKIYQKYGIAYETFRQFKLKFWKEEILVK